ncbi:NAD(P)H-quinone oxidoreductase [Ammoniphilus sp. YIM 78166]|uniref:NAD(P)H-quinone oxidoreductase n=1 Tax=Ammoniphilus sp. YIM 78166 TaxID=1644106 RepID=UPI00106F26D8|nr:NAD(P)H-quinone oxidoreductase [Ammoniphilus sp. YIM 78166]
MKAVLVEEGTSQLYIGQAEDPVPGEEDLLVSVEATALNRADLLQRRGKYPPPAGASTILGLEMAGIVEKVGSNVTRWKVGDRVCALLPGGGYAQKVVIPAGMAISIPDDFSFEQASAIPEAFLTAYLNLVVLGRVSPGDYVLIHAAASGVGTAAIQLVKEMGAIPIATAGSKEKLQVCQRLGAEHVIDYKEEDFSQKVAEISGGKGVQVILDPVGASYWEKNLQSIGVDGRWLVIGGMGGYQLEQVNLQLLMRKRIHLIGSTLRSRTEPNKMELTQAFLSFAEERFKSDKIVPVIDRVFPWAQAMEAHEYMEQNKNIGKVVLRIDQNL